MMGKRTEKLVVYLDQNFLSNMANIGIREKVLPEFKDIYELLHQGFIGEKVVVPRSILHDIESSLATHLKDRIKTCQARLGQVHLYRPEEIWDKQCFGFFDHFLAHTREDPLRPEVAFLDHPDQKVERFGIGVDSHLEKRDFRSPRRRTAQQMEALRLRLLKQNTTYEAQVRTEWDTQRQTFIDAYTRFCGPIPADRLRELAAFTESADFRNIPFLKIEVHLFAAILTRKPTRRITPSDVADIKILSAYSPYMDVVCTDAFMADQIRDFANEYDFELFHAKTGSLRELRSHLSNHLASAPPIRRPSITAFVLPPKERREESFQFFSQLGSALRGMGTLEYGELYAFDDGAMAQYELRVLPGKPVPFFGLQDVTAIPLPSEATEGQILQICRDRCRSDYFVLIDEYREINDAFMLGAAMDAEYGSETTNSYRIFRTRTAAAVGHNVPGTSG
jgi:hypothetical protein